MSLLEVRGLRVSYPLARQASKSKGPRRTAVDGVDLDLDAGRTLALVGESGSGKTTIARAILRLVEPDAGSVRFRGEDLLALSGATMRRRRRDLQMVFQDPWGSLNPRMRVADALFEPMAIHGLASSRERAEAVAALLREVGLPPEAAHRYPHEFSGGQRQRIGVARALATQPAVVIADEPVSALDLSVRGQILNLLTERQSERGLAMLLIAHDLVLVGQVAERVAVLHRGRIVEEGPCAAILESPRHPYTLALLAAVPGSRRRPLAGGGAVPPPPAASRMGGCAYAPVCPWSVPRCLDEVPRLTERERGHRAACFVEPPAAGPVRG